MGPNTMRAWVSTVPGRALEWRERALHAPSAGELRIEVDVCGVCRTDLHLIDGELAQATLPRVPGHEAVGRVDAVGAHVEGWRIGDRVGVPWLGGTCGRCRYCSAGAENLCDAPQFTGCTRDGGYASHMFADAGHCVALPDGDPVALAPLLCAGAIGWRCLRRAGEPARLGLYGFGAAAHIVCQLAVAEGREVYAFTRSGDARAQLFARSLGASWAGGSDEAPPAELDAAILFAPVGALVPQALRAVRKGGRVVCGGIHMSDIPAFPYALLWGEREIVSVANLTRADASAIVPAALRAGIRTRTRRYPLADANRALADLRAGRIDGAAVLDCR